MSATALPFALLQLDPAPSLLENLTFGRMAAAVLIIVLTWFAIRLVQRVLEFLGGRVARARFFFKNIEPIVRITLWFAATYVIIASLSPSTEVFFAGIASIGIALGLGAQDLIKNVVGGLVVLTDRPFQLGDRVQIGDAYGEIDHIGLRSTKMTTPGDTRVTIPNANVMTAEVYNANSGVPDAQVVTDVYLPIDTDADTVLRIGRGAALTSPYLLSTKPVTVLIANQFDKVPHLRLRIKAYVHDHRYEPAMQSDITARIQREFLKQGLHGRWGKPAAS